jgi:hypothetical protein
MTFLDCKDKKIKSKKQILRFKIWQGELKALPLHSFFIVLDFRLTIVGSQRRAFFCPIKKGGT